MQVNSALYIISIHNTLPRLCERGEQDSKHLTRQDASPFTLMYATHIVADLPII